MSKEKTLTEHWGIEPTTYDQYIEYLDNRVVSLLNAHEKWSEKEIGASDEDRVHSSSVAAGIWDTICEMQKAKEMYKKLHNI